MKELDKQDEQAWENNSIVYIDRRIYISNNKKIQEQILQENHDLVDIRHPKQQKIIKLIKRNYWWSGIKEDVKKYVQGCTKCQQNKVQCQKKTRNFIHQKYQEDHGKKSVLILSDYYHNQKEKIPLWLLWIDSQK